MADTTPETFDLDAWIAGAKRKQTRCRVTLQAGLVAEIEDIDALFADARDEDKPALLEQRQALIDAIEGSYVTWRFQDLSQADMDAVSAEMGDRDDAGERGLRLIARQVIEPAGVTYEHLQRMAEDDKVPASVFQAIVGAALSARDALAVDVPFSAAVSAWSSTPASWSS